MKGYKGDPMQGVTCGWFDCQAASMERGIPLCRRHLIKAWKVAQRYLDSIPEESKRMILVGELLAKRSRKR